MTWSMWSVNRQSAVAPGLHADRHLRSRPMLEPERARPYQDAMNDVPETPTGEPALHAALILRVARQQDRSAFADLFGHYGPRVKSYLVRLGANRATAEDLLQEVMLAVWRRADTYDPRQASVATWIFTIARNKRIDALRRERRPELDPSDPMLSPEPAPDPAEEVDAGQWEIHIAAAIREMPREQAEMVRLAYFDDLSHSDIAEKLGLPLGTVKSRLRLALARLRTKFADRA